jgi:hypothetical protein
MTILKSDWALLHELRTQLQQCTPTDIEEHRSDVLSLVDEMINRVEHRNKSRGKTIRTLENAFLAGVLPGKTLSLEEHRKRFEDLENSISALDITGVLHLFFKLEYETANKVYSLYALAQTVKPDQIKEQCPWLPDSLVNDAKRALKASQLAAGETMTHPNKDEVNAAWIEAGLHQRRAKRGEMKIFAQEMAERFKCEADTITNNWIPAWKKKRNAN